MSTYLECFSCSESNYKDEGNRVVVTHNHGTKSSTKEFTSCMTLFKKLGADHSLSPEIRAACRAAVKSDARLHEQTKRERAITRRINQQSPLRKVLSYFCK